jgi:UDP-GlcNAc3NAcA epimerase
MSKIITILGARPQFIKAAAFSHALKAQQHINEILLHTGQHYNNSLSDIFFREFNLAKPKYNLQVGSASHGYQTSQMLYKIEEVLLAEKPRCVLVYGDTNSTLAGALAAIKLHIPIIHIEAGLRSHNPYQAEEINRVLTDRISDLLFVPSIAAANNLIREAISADKIHEVGDIMYDVVKLFACKAQTSTILNDLALKAKDYIVVTIHRAENTDNAATLQKIFSELNKLSTQYNFVLPLHPRTEQSLRRSNLKLSQNIKMTPPLGFLDMMKLVQNANLVITDSGGLQKEAFYHHIPCITLRDVTEWTELVHNGWNILLKPSEVSVLFHSISKAQNINLEWQNPYGQGDTADKIVAVVLKKYF